MEEQEVYRLDKETFEITKIDPERALRIIGYYYKNPRGLLEIKNNVIVTPYAFLSVNKELLEDLKSTKNGGK